MIKGDKRNDPDMRSKISTKSVIIVITGRTTYIPMKKNWRTRNIRVTTDTIKEGVVMAIDDWQPIAEDSMDHDQMGIIGSIGTNIVTTKVRKMSSIRRHIKNSGNHHGITRGFIKTGIS